MALADRVHIGRRFRQSIRIDTDLGDIEAIKGFICPHSSTQMLLTMIQHISQTKHGAFTWTGPYGSGKSSLIIALSALLNGNLNLQKQAIHIFGHDLSDTLLKVLSPGKKGWRIIPVVGCRSDPVSVIGDALNIFKIVPRRPRGGWTENKLITEVIEASRKPRTHGGLILFIDEMGKFLEAAVQEGTDIYIFQQLAEAAARSNGRLLIVGVLHQSFEEYAHRISHKIRNEWAKIQGRFIDLPVNITGDEQVNLISRAIESSAQPKKFRILVREVSKLIRHHKPEDAKHLSSMLESCWPLHPVVACLLGPMSRRRFGQNQRSIFGFLNSAEPYGFQDFLHHTDDNTFYSPDQLWDYLRANLEPSILASPDGHRWTLATEALERCESSGGDLIHLRILKTIAIINLFKEHTGLVASFDLLHKCFPDLSVNRIKTKLSQLSKWSLIIFRKFIDAYAIFSGSDFNIDQAIETTINNNEVNEIDFEIIKELISIQPILAKRHYHETGALRWFEINLVSSHSLKKKILDYESSSGIIGQFIFVVPMEGEDYEHIKKICHQSVRHNKKIDLTVGISKRSWTIVKLTQELIALEHIRDTWTELAGDAIAQKEITTRLVALQGELETELYQAFDTAQWFRKDCSPKFYRRVDLNMLASDLADSYFEKCPKLHNELLNRQKPSGSAVAAQNILLRHMVLNEGQPRLGINGFPSEGGIFSSVLEATGLYMEKAGKWRFVYPQDKDIFRLRPIWDAATRLVKKRIGQTIPISEVYSLWRRRPFGVKDGLMPILIVAFILSCRNNIAVYREGIFRARFDDIDVEYLSKDPATIQIRWMELSDLDRYLLSEMADTVRTINKKNTLVHLEPIDVARGLVAIYDDLPVWTKRTTQLSSNAIKIREIFKRAHDPNQFLFNDIPKMVGYKNIPATMEELENIIKCIREGLEELVYAYPSMLHRLRELMLNELQVPNLSPRSLAELRDRAANIHQITGDFHLEAFVGRLSQFQGTDSDSEAIVSLVIGKPPQKWSDLDLNRVAIDIADLAKKFLRIETYAYIKGRKEKSQAIAVILGISGQYEPLIKEFNIINTDRHTVNNLVKRITAVLDRTSIKKKNVILAALAELSMQYMQDRKKGKGSRGGKKGP